MSSGVPLSNPDITDLERQAVMKVLAGNRLSIGPQTEAFEQGIALRAGRKHGIAVNSGTSGLHLCVKAMGIGEGDEVITTPFSFVATTNCVLFERAKPVFVDIDPASYNMDPSAIETAITPRTKALLPVEVFGNMEHFEAYQAIARKHGLMLLEDCCEALGGSYNGHPAGSFGECGVFAFYPNKQITTGEGGVIVTDDDAIADVCRSLRNQGRDTSAWLSHARMGYNYRISEITAALGAAQIQRLEEILTKRRHVAQMYHEALAGVEEVIVPPMAQEQTASWFVYVIRLADRFSQAQRDALMAHLKAADIGCNPYFVPIHLQPYIVPLLGTRAGQFPITERMAARTMALPFFANMTRSQIATVAAALKAGIKSF